MNVLDNLNAWRAVSAAARTGSVTAAAEQLGIELSKCSRLVSGMEREMGFAFFDAPLSSDAAAEGLSRRVRARAAQP